MSTLRRFADRPHPTSLREATFSRASWEKERGSFGCGPLPQYLRRYDGREPPRLIYVNANACAPATSAGNRGHGSGGTAASESSALPPHPSTIYGSGPLPRFFFHLHDGRTRPDRTGTEFADWQAARRHAVRLAGEFISAEPGSVEFGELWHMEVTDEEGLSLFRLDFHVTLSPAMVHARARKGQLM